MLEIIKETIVILIKFIERLYFTRNIHIESSCQGKKFNIAATIIIKNERKYILEWIEYHRILGIEHFFIYDNESTDETKKILESYIKQGIVSYAFIKGQKKQTLCYEDSVARNKKNVKWMAFLDTDEFINIHVPKNLPSFLNKYENFSGIGINWISYDSNGHETTPQNGFVISNFTRRHHNPNDYLPNKHIKCIVKTSHILCFITPHIPKLIFSFNKNHYLVTENKKKITSPLTETISTKEIQINHYFSKSKEEYLKKIVRGRADNGIIRNVNKNDYCFDGNLTQDPPPICLKDLQKKIPATYF